MVGLLPLLQILILNARAPETIPTGGGWIWTGQLEVAAFVQRTQFHLQSQWHVWIRTGLLEVHYGV